jgi:L-aminopeptidase/D-esterase-like protein
MPDATGAITDVPGIQVGHYTDLEHATGCTVILCGEGAVGGVDVRGGAPGTRETDLLRPGTLVERVHAVLLSGGSAYGLDAASGVMRYLEDEGVGIVFGGSRIPIVPTAILFDLGVITNQVRPGPREGYMACQNASPGPVDEGSVGAGTGATVSGILGMERAVKGGIGTASLDLGQGLVVGAIVAVNAVGSVFDADTGNLVAGPRSEDGATMVNSMALMTSPEFTGSEQPPSSNTTIGVVATNARLSKEQTNKLASVAHDGLAMAVRPAHTMSDGDTMFALATSALDQPANMNRLCAASALCVSRAILRGVQKADGIGGIPSVKEIAEHGNV